MATKDDKGPIQHDECEGQSHKVQITEPSHEVLPRVYNLWTASAYQVLMMASWTCNIVLYSTVFDLGGPMMLIYSTIIVTIGQCLMMASLAELCSVWPYSGGQQAFTKHLAPPSFRRFLSYLVGWTVFIGEIATAAGCAMNNAQIIAAIVQLSNPAIEFTRWQTWLVFVANLAASLFLSFSQKHLPLVAAIGGAITLGGGLTWALAFLALSPKQTARFVFSTFRNKSGYTSSGWVGLMSFYTPVYALYGSDGILHIAEEMQDAPRTAPRAMILSMVLSGVTSLFGALVMAFCCGDWERLMTYDIPFVQWFIETLNNSMAGGIVLLTIVMLLLNFLIVVSINTAGSRLAWGMARDNAFPFSDVFAKVNKTVNTPVNAILLTIVSEAIIGIVIFGSDYAFEAILSLSGAAIQIGYLVPVVMLLWGGRSVLPSSRGFTLSKLGWGINVASCCWSSLVIVILFFPLYVPVNAENICRFYLDTDQVLQGTKANLMPDNMNWAIVMVAGVMSLISVDWVLRARFHYIVAEE